MVNKPLSNSVTNCIRWSMGDISHHGIATPPVLGAPACGEKCYPCRWTEVLTMSPDCAQDGLKAVPYVRPALRASGTTCVRHYVRPALRASGTEGRPLRASRTLRSPQRLALQRREYVGHGLQAVPR